MQRFLNEFAEGGRRNIGQGPRRQRRRAGEREQMW